MKYCEQSGCAEAEWAAGRCVAHYRRDLAAGRLPRRPLVERLLARIDFSVDACWFWTAPLDRDGYGQIKVAGHPERVHRVAYEFFIGPIPDGMMLDHLCRNRHCVRPDHLEPVTAKVNAQRGNVGLTNKRRWLAKTHCKRGHEFTPENTKWVSPAPGKDWRRCLTCSASRGK